MEQKAKRHALLEKLKSDLVKGYRDSEVTVLGRKFKLRTLNEDEEVWADGYTRSVTMAHMLASRKAPRLAAAIREIDGVSVDKLFSYPDDWDKEKRESMDKNQVMFKWWIREQMLYFLSEDTCRPFINELYDSLEKMEAERNEAIKEIPNS